MTAAAAAVGAAQNAGGSGDAELLAYAAAVTALRADKTRDAREVERKKVGLHKARRATQYSKR